MTAGAGRAPAAGPRSRPRRPAALVTPLALAVAGGLGLGGCQFWPFQPTPVPARLDDPSPACLAALSAQARAWTGRPVRLTDAAFATDARLVLDQPPIPGPDGRPLNGRIVDTDPPAVLTLVRVGPLCRAIHPDGGEEADLPGCTCQPLAPTSSPVPPRRGAGVGARSGAVASAPTLPPLPPGAGFSVVQP